MSLVTLAQETREAKIYDVLKASYSVYNHITLKWEEKEVNENPENMYLIIKGNEMKLTTGLRILITNKGVKDNNDKYNSLDFTGVDHHGDYCDVSYVQYYSGSTVFYVFYNKIKPYISVSYVVKLRS